MERVAELSVTRETEPIHVKSTVKFLLLFPSYSLLPSVRLCFQRQYITGSAYILIIPRPFSCTGSLFPCVQSTCHDIFKRSSVPGLVWISDAVIPFFTRMMLLSFWNHACSRVHDKCSLAWSAMNPRLTSLGCFCAGHYERGEEQRRRKEEQQPR